MILITVHDVKAGTWSPPVCVQSIGAACRDFERACKQPNTAMAFAPQDFELFQVGVWNDSPTRLADLNGQPVLQPLEHWSKLASGADYAKE